MGSLSPKLYRLIRSHSQSNSSPSSPRKNGSSLPKYQHQSSGKALLTPRPTTALTLRPTTTSTPRSPKKLVSLDQHITSTPKQTALEKEKSNSVKLPDDDERLQVLDEWQEHLSSLTAEFQRLSTVQLLDFCRRSTVEIHETNKKIEQLMHNPAFVDISMSPLKYPASDELLEDIVADLSLQLEDEAQLLVYGLREFMERGHRSKVSLLPKEKIADLYELSGNGRRGRLPRPAGFGRDLNKGTATPDEIGTPKSSPSKRDAQENNFSDTPTKRRKEQKGGESSVDYEQWPKPQSGIKQKNNDETALADVRSFKNFLQHNGVDTMFHDPATFSEDYTMYDVDNVDGSEPSSTPSILEGATPNWLPESSSMHAILDSIKQPPPIDSAFKTAPISPEKSAPRTFRIKRVLMKTDPSFEITSPCPISLPELLPIPNAPQSGTTQSPTHSDDSASASSTASPSTQLLVPPFIRSKTPSPSADSVITIVPSSSMPPQTTSKGPAIRTPKQVSAHSVFKFSPKEPSLSYSGSSSSGTSPGSSPPRQVLLRTKSVSSIPRMNRRNRAIKIKEERYDSE